MDALVVSLDEEMASIKRVWVVAEIGQAIQCTTVDFRLAMGLAASIKEKLHEGAPLMDSVEVCEATSDEDRQRSCLCLKEECKPVRRKSGTTGCCSSFRCKNAPTWFLSCQLFEKIIKNH